MLEKNYSTQIELRGQKYNLVFSTNAAADAADHFGGLAQIGEVLTKGGEGATYRESIWLLTAMINAGIEIDNFEKGENRRTLTERYVGAVVSPADFAEYEAAMVQAFRAGMSRNVESEEDIKNRAAG